MKTKTHQDLCWHLPLLVAVFIQLWPIVFMVSTSLKERYGPDFSGNTQSIASATDIE